MNRSSSRCIAGMVEICEFVVNEHPTSIFNQGSVQDLVLRCVLDEWKQNIEAGKKLRVIPVEHLREGVDALTRYLVAEHSKRLLFRISILGDRNVGKTRYIQKFYCALLYRYSLEY